MTRPAAALLLLGAISFLLLASRCTPQIPLPPPEERASEVRDGDAGAAVAAGDAGAAGDAWPAPPADGAPTTDAGAPAIGAGAGPAAADPRGPAPAR